MGSAFHKPSVPHAEAFFGLLAAASAADGTNSLPEMTLMARIVKAYEPFASMPAAELDELRRRAMMVLKGSEIRKVVEHYAPHVKAEDRPLCFALCLEILQADGVMEAREADFLGLLRPALKVSEENATRIRHQLRERPGMQCKHCGGTFPEIQMKTSSRCWRCWDG